MSTPSKVLPQITYVKGVKIVIFNHGVGNIVVMLQRKPLVPTNIKCTLSKGSFIYRHNQSIFYVVKGFREPSKNNAQ